MKRFVSVIGSLLLTVCLLNGCSVLPAQAPQSQVHDFGPLPDTQGAATGQVQVDRVAAPAWIDDGAIHYRLVYSDPTSLRSYADHRWVAAPSDLFRLRLQSLLRAQKPSGGSARSAGLLTVEVMEFEQDFPSAQQASVRLTAKASLRKGLDGHLVGEKEFVLSVPSTPDVQGAIAGLAGLAQDAAGQIASWCDEIDRQD
jgi:cholesterol transport system auxiliary component